MDQTSDQPVEGRCGEAAARLHHCLLEQHEKEGVLVGPDPVGKVHWRVTRFVRSYLPWLPGDDRFVYLQGQAYWIKANVILFEATGDERYLDLVCRCADQIARRQPESGAWLHPPIRFRKGFVSTVEGAWASLGLLAAFEVTREERHLEAATTWYSFQVRETGFEKVGQGLAANYYSHSSSRIPNVTTMTIWLAEALFQATGEDVYREYIDPMLLFLKGAQLDTGELPYDLDRIHFMCFQYNAFQFVDLANYYRLSANPDALEVMRPLAAFLAEGVTARGSCRYSCFEEDPETNYWTTALAVALRTAHDLGLLDAFALSERCFAHTLERQHQNGSFDFSYRTYSVLTDRRSYPRYLAMMLYHLLWREHVVKSSAAGCC